MTCPASRTADPSILGLVSVMFQTAGTENVEAGAA
jgi:hypothetical protein